jgi:hypothetical protein
MTKAKAIQDQVPILKPSIGPSRLWQFLGPNGSPFTPTPPQLDMLTQIQVPWPGYITGDDGNVQPYPQIFPCCWGRRCGKTTGGHVLIWHGATAPNDAFGPPTVRVTADTEEHAYKLWDRFTWTFQNTPLKALIDSYSKDRELVYLKTGATVQMLSANNPNALSGDGVTLWVVDESQFIADLAWKNMLPSISDRNGVIAAFGVAQGESYFKVMNRMGDDPDYPEYKRLSYPTSANPYITKHALDLARRVHTDEEFTQLYLAQFSGEAGKVFRNVQGCVDPSMTIYVAPEGYGYTEEYRGGNKYYIGVDLARTNDYTVITIWGQDGRLVAWDRFNLVSWEAQKARIHLLAMRYDNPAGYADANGKGDAVVEDLVNRGLALGPLETQTNLQKHNLIDAHAIKMGAGCLRFPPIAGMVKEHEEFAAKRSKTGNVILYEAPTGMHDDWVISSALGTNMLPLSERLVPPVRRNVEDDMERNKAAYEYI